MTRMNEQGGAPVIGLTGAYCAGKNYVGRLLEERGLPVLDVDKLGHRVLDQEREAVAARFGREVLGADGSVNRRLLGERVFGKPEELAALEGIVHPGVNRLTSEWIAAMGGRPCVINAALLHRSSVFAGLSAVILVTAPLLTRLLRARRRDRLSWGELLRRFRSQRRFASQYLAGGADIYIVRNRGTATLGSRLWKKALEARVERIFAQMGIKIIGEK